MRKTLLAIMLIGTLLAPGAAQAVGLIDSLDFVVSDSKFLDCEVLGKVELEHDASWVNEEFYLNLLAQYRVNLSDGEYSDIDDYRNQVEEAAKNNWNEFFNEIYRDYASVVHDDFYEHPTDYNTYHSDLADDYFKAQVLADVEVFPTDLGGGVGAYDIVANYCGDDIDSQIRTTFAGNNGFLKLDGREVEIDEKELIAIDNGYMFFEDGFGELRIELSKEDETTVKAEYILKNLTGHDTDFGVAFQAIPVFGGNFSPAIFKTDREIMLIQDDSRFSSTFGMELKVQLDGAPSSINIGDYSEDEYSYWLNSEKDHYTEADQPSDIMAYAWRGEIKKDEEKRFSAVYTIDSVEWFDNNLHFSNGNSEIVQIVEGGALRFPENTLAEAGMHYEWNTESDGSGEFYKGGSVIAADKNQADYYEVKVSNKVVLSKSTGRDYFGEHEIVLIDSLREKMEKQASAAYSDLDLWVGIDEDYQVEQYIEDAEIDVGRVVEATGDDYEIGAIFSVGGGKTYLDSEGEEQWDEFGEDELPVLVRAKISDRRAKNKNDFKVVKIECDFDAEMCDGDYTLVPSEFDGETSELVFEWNGYDEAVFALMSVGEPEEVEEPEMPDVPNTGTRRNDGNFVKTTGCLLTVAIASVAVCYWKRKKDPKAHEV